VGQGSGPSPTTPLPTPSDSWPMSQSLTSSPSPTPRVTPSPTPASGPFTVAWSSVTLPGEDIAIQSILSTGDRLIVAGRDGVEAGVWLTDDDGDSWQRASIVSTREEDEGTSFAEIVEVDGSLVGVGWWGRIPSDQFAWMTWRSTDGGSTWSEERDDSQPYAMRAATAHDGGVVGVGWTYAGTTPFDSWLAVSEDGSSWQRIDPGEMRRSQVNAIASTRERLIAVGHRWGESFEQTGAAWLSDDGGASWRRIELGSLDGAPAAFARDVLVRQDGTVVAVGSSTDGRDQGVPTAWISTDDGETWRVENMGAGGSADTLVEIDRGLVAIGALELYDPGPIASYTSEDGILWMSTERVAEDDAWPLAAGQHGGRPFAGLGCASQGPCPHALMEGSLSDAP
jgi:hypothetical protein